MVWWHKVRGHRQRVVTFAKWHFGAATSGLRLRCSCGKAWKQ